MGGAEAAGAADLFDAELAPVIRRLGARARGTGDLLDPERDVAARRAVWQGLAEAGALGPATGRELRPMLGLYELMGGALLHSPYFETLTAAELAADHAPDLCEGVAAGGTVLTTAARERAADDPGRPRPVRLDPANGRVSGVRSFVAFAADADLLMVIGTDAESGPAAVLVRRDQPGVRLRRHDDLGRSDLYAVRFDEAVAERVLPAAAAGRWPAVLARARLRHAAYLLGLCAGALELTAEYARNRQIFGKPLATFQEPAFRLAAFAARVEAARTLVHQACGAADAGGGAEADAGRALLLAAGLAVEVTAEAVQLHGSHGLTEGCDAQLFYRRAVVDAMTLGTPGDLRRTIERGTA